MANIRYDTVHFTILILLYTNTVLPSLPAVCKGERKPLLSNFIPERYILQLFFLSQVVLIEREEEERRGAQQKYAHLSWASINPLPQLKPGCGLGQHIFASATSAASFSFLVRKKKNLHEGLSTGIWCPRLLQKDLAELVSLSRPLALVFH